MKHCIVALRDSALASFGLPQSMPSRAVAVRVFTDKVNDRLEKDALQMHPEDFELWQIAEYDDDDASFRPVHELLVRGKDVRREPSRKEPPL